MHLLGLGFRVWLKIGQGSGFCFIYGSGFIALVSRRSCGAPKEDRRSKNPDGPKGSEAVPTVDGGNLAPHSKVVIILRAV